MGMRNKLGQFVKGTHWRSRKPWWNKKWLNAQYTTNCHSAADIAREWDVHESAIFYWLIKHGIPRRTIRVARKVKHWGVVGPDNPMWNKRGELNPNWRGGVTPERQAFYTSNEWKAACSAVWKRDNATCQRCGLDRRDDTGVPFHIHHIESFANSDLRADIKNLVLLCEVCHNFVHSRRNINSEHLSQK